jgi:acyl-CoA hydrolase
MPKQKSNAPRSAFPLKAKPISASRSEMAEVVLPATTNPLGKLLGGHVMHLVDIAAAMAASRHSNSYVVTASVDYIDFRNPVSIGEIVILKSQVNRVFHTSMEVGVKVFSENALSGEKKHTTTAYVTFVAIDALTRQPKAVAPLLLTAPTQIGVVVGCRLPPSGSSVIARFFVFSGESGGLATSKSNFPSASGRRVSEGTGLAPGAFGISHSCSVRLPLGSGNFWPETTMPNSRCHAARSRGKCLSWAGMEMLIDFGSVRMSASRRASASCRDDSSCNFTCAASVSCVLRSLPRSDRASYVL